MRNELARWEVRAIRRVVRHFTFCNVHLHLLHFLLSSEILDECGVVNRTLRFKYKSNQIVYMQIISFSYCNIFLEVRYLVVFICKKISFHGAIHGRTARATNPRIIMPPPTGAGFERP